MIDDENLKKICLILTIIGLIVLFFVVNNIKPLQVNISQIDESKIGNYIMVTGKIITKPVWKNDNLFFTIKDESGKIKIVMFSQDTRKYPELNIAKNDEVLVEGRVNEYKGELEIVAKKIEVIG